VDTTDKGTDKPSSLNKAIQYENLRLAYIAAGRPLQHVTLRDGSVNWQEDGCYLIFKEARVSGAMYFLKDKVLAKALLADSWLWALRPAGLGALLGHLFSSSCFDTRVQVFERAT